MAAITPERRWDPIVRITHWGIAAAIVTNGVLTDEGSKLHVWVGYAVAGLLVLRLLWGLIGSPEARFSAFPPSPTRALAHIREIVSGRRSKHRSHNPLGALMVYALWGTLQASRRTGSALSNLRNDQEYKSRPQRSGYQSNEAHVTFALEAVL